MSAVSYNKLIIKLECLLDYCVLWQGAGYYSLQFLIENKALTARLVLVDKLIKTAISVEMRQVGCGNPTFFEWGGSELMSPSNDILHSF